MIAVHGTDLTVCGRTWHAYDYAVRNAADLTACADMLEAATLLAGELSFDADLPDTPDARAAVVAVAFAALTRLVDDGQIVIPDGWDPR